MGDRQGAIGDLQTAANLFSRQGDTIHHQQAIAALTTDARQLFPASLVSARACGRMIGAMVTAALLYLVAGSLLRMIFEAQVAGGLFYTAVRGAAAAGLAGALITLLAWRTITTVAGRWRLGLRTVVAMLIVISTSDLWQFASWARGRTELNYRASVEVGRLLPPGTLVHGKLANGMALENRIRPIFVGMGFGNYGDRLERDDARYILTYSLPEVGRESYDGLIREILNQYPQRQVVATFDVQETPGVDQAVLIDKNPAR